MRFDRPSGWGKRRVILRFGSIESIGHVWLNGEPLGVCKDSRLPSEFDITERIQAKDNVLAVQVIQWSDATFIEDQDQSWQAGIARDVDLLALPKTGIEDAWIDADFDPVTKKGSLKVSARIDNLLDDGWQVRYQVFDAENAPYSPKPVP